MDIKSHSPFKLEIYRDESAPDKNYKTFSMVYSLNLKNNKKGTPYDPSSNFNRTPT